MDVVRKTVTVPALYRPADRLDNRPYVYAQNGTLLLGRRRAHNIGVVANNRNDARTAASRFRVRRARRTVARISPTPFREFYVFVRNGPRKQTRPIGETVRNDNRNARSCFRRSTNVRPSVNTCAMIASRRPPPTLRDNPKYPGYLI